MPRYTLSLTELKAVKANTASYSNIHSRVLWQSSLVILIIITSDFKHDLPLGSNNKTLFIYILYSYNIIISIGTFTH